MKTFFETIAVAFSIFSSIPMPRFEWNKKNMRYMLLAFPLIGVVTGVISILWCQIATALSLPQIALGAGLTLIPVFITGGIHLDGYVDTSDALASHGDPDKMAQILRDPHIGAFAAIRLGAYYVLTLAVWSSFSPEKCGITFYGIPLYIIYLILIFTISRVLSGLAVVSFDRTKEEDLLHVFYDYSDAKKVRVILIVADINLSAIFCLTGLTGVLMVVAAHLVFIFYHHQCKVKFGGVSGDQAGWFLTVAELWTTIVMVAAQYLPF